MKESKIIISLYFKPQYSRESFSKLIEVFEGVSGSFGFQLNGYSYGYYKKPGSKLKGEEGKYEQFDKNNLYKLFEKFTPGAIDLSSAPADAHVTRDSSLFIYYAINRPNIAYSQIVILIDAHHANEIAKSKTDIFVDILKDTFLIVDVKYGFLTQMSTKKMPIAYFVGQGSPLKMSHEEKERDRMWRQHRGNYDSMIWDIFWGNTLSKKLHGAEALKNITSIVGEENVRDLTDNMVYIQLPVSLADAVEGNDEYDRLRLEVRKAITPELLMVK